MKGIRDLRRGGRGMDPVLITAGEGRLDLKGRAGIDQARTVGTGWIHQKLRGRAIPSLGKGRLNPGPTKRTVRLCALARRTAPFRDSTGAAKELLG
jgi:hypothetical protein